jgi:glycerol-3-phosphate dehydrogenase (NAD(P)+)
MGLAQGRRLEEVLASLGHVAEGVYSAHTVVQRAHSLGVDMPIAQAVVSVLQGQVSPSQAVASLMGRDAKGE